jgi:hypothetical protein
MKTFVIAGTIDQAKTWIKMDAEKRYANGNTSISLSDYVVVNQSLSLKGVSNPHGMFVGTWWERNDIPELIAHLSFQSHQYNPALTKVKEIYESKRGTVQV